MNASKVTTAYIHVPSDQEPQTGMSFRKYKGNQKIIINTDVHQKTSEGKNKDGAKGAASNIFTNFAASFLTTNSLVTPSKQEGKTFFVFMNIWKKCVLCLAALLCLAASAQKRFTISGYVKDIHSSETLLGATIQDAGSHMGTTTNSYGFYTLTLPAGQVRVDYSYVGYARMQKSFVLDKDTVVNIQLTPSANLPEVVVSSAKDNAGILATGMGVTDIGVSQIEHTPSLLGETDVIRTIQLMPGVQPGSDGGSALYVRGGNGDENLILLDGTPIYKIDHLFGFFSVFTPEALKKVTFYKSSYPARYNGRLSSVIDVRTKDGDMNHFHGTASLGLLTSRVQLEGPIVKNRTSFNFSARTTYINWVLQPFMKSDEKFGYQFYDLHFKLNHRFSHTDRLYLSVYRGHDMLKEDYKDRYTSSSYEINSAYGDDINWGNTIASLRWNHIFSNNLFANITAAYNHYNMHLDSYEHSWRTDVLEKNSASYRSKIRDWSAAIDFDYEPLPSHRIKFGSSYTYHTFSPETSGSFFTEEGKDGKVNRSGGYSSPSNPIYAHEALAYAEDDWRILPSLTLNAGGSVSMFHVRNKSYFTFQPRVSLRWQALSDVALKASYSEMSQYIHLLTSMPIALPTDLWVPITDNIKPERSRQYSVGAYYTGWKGWELSAESYYKQLDNVLEYKDGMSFMGFSGNWERLVSMGEGRSKGIELMLRRTTGRATGWLSYTLSKSDRKFSEDSGVNGGERFPFTYDRRHNVNMVANWKMTKRIDLDATWSFYSGATATISLQKGFEMTPESIGESSYVSSRNNYRLPPTHLLCLGINFRKTLKRGVERTWNISVYNAYNAMNPNFILRKTDEYGKEVPNKLTKYTLLPCLPSFTLTYKF